VLFVNAFGRVMSHIVVIGGGHAGVEAAYACARLGVKTTLVTLRKEGIGQMSCNPAIGGLGKGQIVKEVDVLGGLMGLAIDHGGLQFRTLNASKGPAVRASRVQADRELYKNFILHFLENTPNLSILEGEVASIEAKNNSVSTVVLKDGSELKADKIVLTSGTFLRGLMHTGEEKTSGGRKGDNAANYLSASLEKLGFTLGRLKTGTPARIDKNTIDYSVCEEQPGETPAKPFSFMTEKINQQQLSCWLTKTNEAVHDHIRENKDRSPMFNGQIKSGGPRYCPSIEDKVFRFADKTSHNVFLEPEGYTSNLVYPNGISTSLPKDVQDKFIRLIPGLKDCSIVQYGYAVEYDFVDPRGLKPTLETKLINGLYFAGQINGTSGYEEAAGQGVIAGTNAALSLKNQETLVLSRSEAYIGVMIDDLITNGVEEPYRMFTSRAEYRLLLREDNTITRLGEKSKELGLLNTQQLIKIESLENEIRNGRNWLKSKRFKPSDGINTWLENKNSSLLKDGVLAEQLLKRPEISINELLLLDSEAPTLGNDSQVSLETETKFEGYLTRQQEEIDQLKKSEELKIPESFSYDAMPGLRVEFREKFKKNRPYSLGAAARIPGIPASAVGLLAVYLKKALSNKQSGMISA